MESHLRFRSRPGPDNKATAPRYAPAARHEWLSLTASKRPDLYCTEGQMEPGAAGEETVWPR